MISGDFYYNDRLPDLNIRSFRCGTTFMYAWYRRDSWWVFIVIIFYKFALGLVLAVAEGHPTGQAVAQMIVEAPLLGILAWARPFQLCSSNNWAHTEP